MLQPIPGGPEALCRTFDFAKLSNLEAARFAVPDADRGASWLYRALLTIKPVTSPHLSTLVLDLHSPQHPLSHYPGWLEHSGGDIPLIAREVHRIEKEFAGTVDVVLTLPPGFEVGKLGSKLRQVLTDFPELSFLKRVKNL